LSSNEGNHVARDEDGGSTAGRTNSTVSRQDDAMMSDVGENVSYGNLTDDSEHYCEGRNQAQVDDLLLDSDLGPTSSDHSMNLAEAKPVAGTAQNKTCLTVSKSADTHQVPTGARNGARTASEEVVSGTETAGVDSDWRGSAVTVHEDNKRSCGTYSRTESLEDSVREAEETRSVGTQIDQYIQTSTYVLLYIRTFDLCTIFFNVLLYPVFVLPAYLRAGNLWVYSG
jgi:hypothetical protein